MKPKDLDKVVAALRAAGESEAAVKLEAMTEAQWAECGCVGSVRNGEPVLDVVKFEGDLVLWLLWSFRWCLSPDGELFWCDVTKRLRNRK